MDRLDGLFAALRIDPLVGQRLLRGLLLLVILGLLWHLGNLALRAPNPEAPAAAVEMPPLLASVAVVTRPLESPTPSQVKPMRVGNTGGEGVYLRATPLRADRLKAYADGTVMRPTGKTAEGDGLRWVEVTAPDGPVGWVPADYLVP